MHTEVDPTREEARGALGLGTGGGDVGVEGAGPAARPVFGESGTERRPARERFPFGAQPALGAVDDLAAGHVEQRRDRLQLERERHLEIGVVDDLHGVGERRVVLRVDGEGDRAVGDLGEHRRHQPAGRAVALDDRHQPVGEWRCGHACSMR